MTSDHQCIKWFSIIIIIIIIIKSIYIVQSR